MARIAYVEPEAASPETSEWYDRYTGGDPSRRVINLVKMWANSPRVQANLQRLGNTLLRHTELDPNLREVAIVAVVRRSEYELFHHKPVARSTGLSDEQIQAILDEDYVHPALSPAQRAVLRYALAYDAGHGVADRIFATLKEHLSDRQIVELSIVCGFWGNNARLALALGLDIEDGRAAEAAEINRNYQN